MVKNFVATNPLYLHKLRRDFLSDSTELDTIPEWWFVSVVVDRLDPIRIICKGDQVLAEVDKTCRSVYGSSSADLPLTRVVGYGAETFTEAQALADQDIRECQEAEDYTRDLAQRIRARFHPWG